MDFNEITIQDVEAALASMEKPLEGENPYWHQRNVSFLTRFLEFLKVRGVGKE
jgi:hypothetical protein